MPFVAGTIGIIILLITVFFVAKRIEFVSGAEKVTGHVVAEVVKESTDSEGRPVGTYYPRVRFVTMDNTEYEFVSSVGDDDPTYDVGDRIDVIYSPSAPSEAFVSSFLTLWAIYLLPGGVGLLICFVGFGSALRSTFQNRRADQLKISGELVRAELQDPDTTRLVSPDRAPLYYLAGRWKEPASQKDYIFQSERIWLDPKPYLHGRTHLEVYIDPQNPERYYVDISFLPKH